MNIRNGDPTLTLVFNRDGMGEGSDDERAAFATYCARVAREVADAADLPSVIITTRPTRVGDDDSIFTTNVIFDACCAHPEDAEAAVRASLRALGYDAG